MSLVAVRLQFAPYASVVILDGLRLGRILRFACVRVDPLLNLNRSGPVVEFVGYVCGLVRYVADLANECKLGPVSS